MLYYYCCLLFALCFLCPSLAIICRRHSVFGLHQNLQFWCSSGQRWTGYILNSKVKGQDQTRSNALFMRRRTDQRGMQNGTAAEWGENRTFWVSWHCELDMTWWCNIVRGQVDDRVLCHVIHKDSGLECFLPGTVLLLPYHDIVSWTWHDGVILCVDRLMTAYSVVWSTRTLVSSASYLAQFFSYHVMTLWAGHDTMV